MQQPGARRQGSPPQSSGTAQTPAGGDLGCEQTARGPGLGFTLGRRWTHRQFDFGSSFATDWQCVGCLFVSLGLCFLIFQADEVAPWVPAQSLVLQRHSELHSNTQTLRSPWAPAEDLLGSGCWEESRPVCVPQRVLSWGLMSSILGVLTLWESRERKPSKALLPLGDQAPSSRPG